MSSDLDHDIIRHLRRQEWPLTAWLFGSIRIDDHYFKSNASFATALQRIKDIQTITHFNHDDPTLESVEEQSDELTDTHYRLTVRYVKAFKRVRASIPFVAVWDETAFLLITPLKYWSFQDEIYLSGDTRALGLELFYYEQKLTSPRPSDEILQETWKFATKSGDRDMRYKENISAILVQRYGVKVLLQDGSKWEMGGLSADAQDRLLTALQEITDKGIADEYREDNDIDEEYEADESLVDDLDEDKYEREVWYDVLGVSPDATHQEIQTAYLKTIKQYHPDRAAGLGEKLRALAEIESQKLNAARDEATARSR